MWILYTQKKKLQRFVIWVKYEEATPISFVEVLEIEHSLLQMK